MFLQRCFYIFIKWASTLSPFLETLPTSFLFLFREKRMACGVHRQPILPLCLVSEKQHVGWEKTTRHFDENDTSFWWKQHVVFVETTRRFFRSKKHSLYQGVDLLSFFKGTPLTHKTSPHKHIFLSFSRKSYHKIWSIAKNTINLPHKVCRITYWNRPCALNLED